MKIGSNFLLPNIENFNKKILLCSFLLILQFFFQTGIRLYCSFFFLYPGIGEYFNLSEGLRKDAVFAILLELTDIKNWFENQRRFAFYSSSLLCIYEGLWPCKHHLAAVSRLHPSNRSIVNGDNSDCCTTTNIEDLLQSSYGRKDSCVKVKMIDFSHVYTTCERDNNYLTGLDSLINYLKRLLTEL